MRKVANRHGDLISCTERTNLSMFVYIVEMVYSHRECAILWIHIIVFFDNNQVTNIGLKIEALLFRCKIELILKSMRTFFAVTILCGNNANVAVFGRKCVTEITRSAKFNPAQLVATIKDGTSFSLNIPVQWFNQIDENLLHLMPV